ncbi:hypothetical protein RHIZ404_220205 [Rhizobium sp. EC-SD404]|nr:hypothetical protein RHIZ404_220205 [Rhizobium sp. EC-SD404]
MRKEDADHLGKGIRMWNSEINQDALTETEHIDYLFTYMSALVLQLLKENGQEGISK